MRWLAKAALQRGLGTLPQGERLNYVFQRRVLRSLPAGDPALRRKFSRALQHLGVYRERSPGVAAGEATFYEFGAGWDLAIPLAYGLLGVGRQVQICKSLSLHGTSLPSCVTILLAPGRSGPIRGVP